ncbi:6243_t:CDS:2, partial [Funneliformis geosporum]
RVKNILMIDSLTGITSIKDIYQSSESLSKLAKIKVVVCPPDLAEKIKQINFGSSLIVNGKLKLTPERAQSCELQVREIEFINPSAGDYPLQKKSIPLEIVREYPHLRAKTNYFLTLFRLRHSISKAIHDFFHQENFYYVPTPIITSDDAEGAGELFNITTKEKEAFFSKPTTLTVSGQLQAEALTQGLEMAFTDLETIINLAKRLVKDVINYIITNNIKELEFLENYNRKETINKLKRILNNDFREVDYSEGMDLQSEHEKYLCQYFDNSPVFITNYPTDLKAFYMKNNPDEKTVACFDLLLPEIGELIGGNLRKYGYAPSGGFGLGLERLIMFISGTENIRDTIAFPRYSS